MRTPDWCARLCYPRPILPSCASRQRRRSCSTPLLYPRRIVRSICGMASSTVQRIMAVRVSGARGELAQRAKTWVLDVTLETRASGKSFGSILGNRFLSTRSYGVTLVYRIIVGKTRHTPVTGHCDARWRRCTDATRWIMRPLQIPLVSKLSTRNPYTEYPLVRL